MTTTPTQTPIVNAVLVQPSSPNGWVFLQEAATGVGGFVGGPPTPPLGTGSAQLQVNNTGIESLANGLYAGTRLDQLVQLTYQTYTQSSTPPEAIMLQLDMDYNLNDANTAPQGRLVYDPGLNGTPVVGAWQAWNALNGKWYATAAPGNGVCPQVNPCTLAQVITAFPDAGIRVGATGPGDPAGQIRFVAGGWGISFLGNVDDFTIGVSGTMAGKLGGLAGLLRVSNTTITTYNFEPSAPTGVTVRSFDATAGGSVVTLRWETASEANLLGFRVWRSAAANGGYEAVGPSLIPAEMAVSGASYTWSDTSVADGRWYYKLEAVGTDGMVMGTYGPTMVTVGTTASNPPYRIFLPLLNVLQSMFK